MTNRHVRDWIKVATKEIRWWMVLWVALLTVVVWVVGAPAWVAVIFGVWLLYKENE